MRRREPEPSPGLPQIKHTPGMADEMMRELAPLLAEEGFDLDSLEVEYVESLQAALDRAIERRSALAVAAAPETWSRLTHTLVKDLAPEHLC